MVYACEAGEAWEHGEADAGLHMGWKLVWATATSVHKTRLCNNQCKLQKNNHIHVFLKGKKKKKRQEDGCVSCFLIQQEGGDKHTV